MLRIRVGSVWLSTIGAYGNVIPEYGINGPDKAQWRMAPDTAHPALRGNKLVEIFDGGFCVWSGTLVEPGNDGEFSARGLWSQAERTSALNSSGDYTTFPNDAILQAFTRGDISWSGTVAGVDAAWATSATGELTLAQLLNGYCNENGLRWRVSADRVVTASVDPTTPSWYVPHAVAGKGLTPAEDDFITHLVGRYKSGASTYDSETVGSATAATVFGRRTARVDLSPMEVITGTRANSVLTGMFLLAGARMGWAEGLELKYGQIVTSGGVPAPLAQVRAGQMIRLNGVLDTSRPNLMASSLDVVIGQSRYNEAENTITLAPVGYAVRTLSDVFSVAVEGDQ